MSTVIERTAFQLSCWPTVFPSWAPPETLYVLGDLDVKDHDCQSRDR